MNAEQIDTYRPYPPGTIIHLDQPLDPLDRDRAFPGETVTVKAYNFTTRSYLVYKPPDKSYDAWVQRKRITGVLDAPLDMSEPPVPTPLQVIHIGPPKAEPMPKKDLPPPTVPVAERKPALRLTLAQLQRPKPAPVPVEEPAPRQEPDPMPTLTDVTALDPITRAELFDDYMKANKTTAVEAAKQYQVPESLVYGARALLKLDEDLKEKVRAGELSVCAATTTMKQRNAPTPTPVPTDDEEEEPRPAADTETLPPTSYLGAVIADLADEPEEEAPPRRELAPARDPNLPSVGQLMHEVAKLGTQIEVMRSALKGAWLENEDLRREQSTPPTVKITIEVNGVKQTVEIG